MRFNGVYAGLGHGCEMAMVRLDIRLCFETLRVLYIDRFLVFLEGF